jgi:hypothetical protein
MNARLRSTAWMVVIAVLATGCSDEASDAEADIGQAGGAPTEAAPAGAVSAAPSLEPDTTEEALWAYLEVERYRDSWPLWPGKGQLYEGQEPHGMLLTTYTNQTAYDALLAGDPADLPPGAIIVKENWTPDSTYAAVTVMYKVDGYNPDHADWLFAKYDPDGAVEAFGRAAGCQACHVQAGSNYIYTAVER